MHPIGIGAPVERMVSRYVFGFFAVLLAGFLATRRSLRLKVLDLAHLGRSVQIEDRVLVV